MTRQAFAAMAAGGPVLLDGATGRIYLEPDPNLVQQPVVRTPRRAPRQLQMR